MSGAGLAPCRGHDRNGSSGAYVLANDRARMWLLPFLESFRAHNATLPLVVIPFDEHVEATLALCERFGCDMLATERLEPLDEIARSLVPRHDKPGPLGKLRKYAAFDGPFESFAFFDCDIVVLADVKPLLTALDDTRPFLWVHGGRNGGAIDEVYRPGPLRRRMLDGRRTFAGNSGAWTARRDLLGSAQLAELEREARPLVDQFAYWDQGFLNFCLDTLGVSAAIAAEAMPGTRFLWAGEPGARVLPRGRATRMLDEQGLEVALVHWAGYGLGARMPYRRLWEEFRLAGTAPALRPVYRGSYALRAAAGRARSAWRGR